VQYQKRQIRCEGWVLRHLMQPEIFPRICLLDRPVIRAEHLDHLQARVLSHPAVKVHPILRMGTLLTVMMDLAMVTDRAASIVQTVVTIGVIQIQMIQTLVVAQITMTRINLVLLRKHILT
jgi:hypothetical protein